MISDLIDVQPEQDMESLVLRMSELVGELWVIKQAMVPLINISGSAADTALYEQASTAFAILYGAMEKRGLYQ